MSYGDDVDLLYVYEPADAADAAGAREFFISGRVRFDCGAAETRRSDGSLYHVELPPWPRVRRCG